MMALKKLLVSFLLLFAFVSIPHFEDVVHSLVHERGIAHTHDHAEAVRTGAHFHRHDHDTEKEMGEPLGSHHHDECRWEHNSIAAGLARLALEKLQISVSVISPSLSLKPSPVFHSSMARTPSGNLRPGFFPSHPANAPPAC